MRCGECRNRLIFLLRYVKLPTISLSLSLAGWGHDRCSRYKYLVPTPFGKRSSCYQNLQFHIGKIFLLPDALYIVDPCCHGHERGNVKLPMSMNNEPSKLGYRDQVREPGSVPFVWEEKPGRPKQNYIISTLIVADPSPSPKKPAQQEKDCIILTSIADPSPARLVISVPFQWEEEPGKPKICSPARLDSVLLSSPTTCIREEEEEDRFEDCEEDIGDEGDNELFELDFESFAFDENDLPMKSFSRSTPSMLANCSSTMSEMSNAIPKENTAPIADDQTSTGSGQGTSSIEDDSSYIEFHFPLVTPHSGFLQKVFAAENNLSDGSRQESGRQSCCRINCIKVKRTPPTLGDLIFTNCTRGKPKRSLAAVHNQGHASSPLDRMACRAFGTGSGRQPPLTNERP